MWESRKECVCVCVCVCVLCVWEGGSHYLICNQQSLIYCVSPTHHTQSCVCVSESTTSFMLCYQVFAFLASSVSETAALSRIAVSFWMKMRLVNYTMAYSSRAVRGWGWGFWSWYIPYLIQSEHLAGFTAVGESAAQYDLHNLCQWPTKDQNTGCLLIPVVWPNLEFNEKYQVQWILTTLLMLGVSDNVQSAGHYQKINPWEGDQDPQC